MMRGMGRNRGRNDRNDDDEEVAYG